MRIAVGEGSCGIASGAAAVYGELEKFVSSGTVLGITGCIGMCWLEPIVDIYDGKELKARLVKVKQEDAQRIALAADTGDMSPVADLIINDDDASFLTKQTRVALENCGIVDPADINSYIEYGGYNALEKAVCTLTPEQVIEEVKISGLAGR
ncbi:MAG: NADH-quinone oxidoreductase subunit F, partial [Clostridia bacterium]|nr:NADH-quinone oxidoreductase subunit F [Clostridia bacterium]